MVVSCLLNVDHPPDAKLVICVDSSFGVKAEGPGEELKPCFILRFMFPGSKEKTDLALWDLGSAREMFLDAGIDDERDFRGKIFVISLQENSVRLAREFYDLV